MLPREIHTTAQSGTAATATVLTDMQIKCKNRPAYADAMTVQNGWNADGTRAMTTIAARNSKGCMFDLKHTQPGCRGCHWQTPDVRDLIAD